MTEEQLMALSEQQIRARFACAPAYYLQAKLEKKRALDASATQAPALADEDFATPQQLHCETALPVCEPVGTEPATAVQNPHRVTAAGESLDFALPGFEILDAALSGSDAFQATQILSGEASPELTQTATLESALEDYSNWPIRSAPEVSPASVLERKLALVLDRAPEVKPALDEELEFDLTLELEPELEVVLDSKRGSDSVLEPQYQNIPDNVTVADFAQRAPGTVPVVSVVMDRKRPNMVRVVGKSSRRAS
jgi:hypothetical protein